MKKGDIVTVFEDPMTKQRPEGKARLVNKLEGMEINGLQTWMVQFLDDEDGITYRRFI